MKVTTLIGTNFEEFDLDFTDAVRRQNALIGIPLDCLLSPYAVGNYNVVFNYREGNIIFCANLRGQAFNNDADTLYNILVQYIGTSGNGHTRSKKGRKCYLEIKGDLKTEAYEETKASKINAILKFSHYDGNRNLTLEHYYNLVMKAFYYLEESGPVYTLIEAQKIN